MEEDHAPVLSGSSAGSQGTPQPRKEPGGAVSSLARELAALPPFADLTPAALERIAALVRLRRYEAGEFVDREGEPCTAMYVIRSGLVRRFKTSADGKEQVLKLLPAGETFNEVPIFDGGPNPASSQAVEPSELYVLRRDDLTALMAANPAVAVGLTRTLAARLRHLTGMIEDLSFRHVTGRVARLLLDQADGRVPAARISQQEMAAMVGTAREVVGRALRALEAAGAVRLDRGRVEIRDRARLETYV